MPKRREASANGPSIAPRTGTDSPTSAVRRQAVSMGTRVRASPATGSGSAAASAAFVTSRPTMVGSSCVENLISQP